MHLECAALRSKKTAGPSVVDPNQISYYMRLAYPRPCCIVLICPPNLHDYAVLRGPHKRPLVQATSDEAVTWRDTQGSLCHPLHLTIPFTKHTSLPDCTCQEALHNLGSAFN